MELNECQAKRVCAVVRSPGKLAHMLKSLTYFYFPQHLFCDGPK
jgi:hypothetical protein